jgi:hypothetical protein
MALLNNWRAQVRELGSSSLNTGTHLQLQLFPHLQGLHLQAGFAGLPTLSEEEQLHGLQLQGLQQHDDFDFLNCLKRTQPATAAAIVAMTAGRT